MRGTHDKTSSSSPVDPFLGFGGSQFVLLDHKRGQHSIESVQEQGGEDWSQVTLGRTGTLLR